MTLIRCLTLPLLICTSLVVHAASCTADTAIVYLDQDLRFTQAKTATYKGRTYAEAGGVRLEVFFENGTTMYSARYRDAACTQHEGPATLYYQDGTLQGEGQYRDGKKWGAWQWFYANGNKKDSGAFEQDAMTGVWRSWHDNGQLKNTATFTLRKLFSTGSKGAGVQKAESFANGPYQSWYETGIPESSGLYSEGKMSGAWTWYHTNGQRSTEEFYLTTGKLDSMACFDTLGQLQGNFCSIQKPATLIELGDFTGYLSNNMKLPELANKYKKNGVVLISYSVGTDGKLKKLHVNGSNQELAQAVANFIKTLPDWHPAVQHNRVVPWTDRIELRFSTVGYQVPIKVPAPGQTTDWYDREAF